MAPLTPAIDNAVYQAELAVCGAKLNTHDKRPIGEALQYKRRYPDRLCRDQPSTIHGGPTYGGDDRPAIAQYVGAGLNKVLNCPLSKAVGIEWS